MWTPMVGLKKSEENMAMLRLRSFESTAATSLFWAPASGPKMWTLPQKIRLGALISKSQKQTDSVGSTY